MHFIQISLSCWSERLNGVDASAKIHARDLGAGYTVCAQVSYPHLTRLAIYIDWLTVGKYISDS